MGTPKSDVGGGEEPAVDDTKTEDEDAAMKEKCCTNCVEAYDKLKPDMPVEEIMCADFTTELSPWCLEHFKSNPTKACDMSGRFRRSSRTGA